MNITFDYLLPKHYIFFIIIISCIFIFYSIYKKNKNTLYRGLIFLFFIVLVINPSVTKKKYTELKDTVLIVNDLSESQTRLKKDIQSTNAVEKINNELNNLKKFNIRNIQIKNNLSPDTNGTRVFKDINDAIADVPANQLGGIIIVSDGQIHDANLYKDYPFNVPVHLIVSGSKNEYDRRLIVTNPPRYGIVGEELSIKLRIADTLFNGEANVNITINNEDIKIHRIKVNEDTTIKFKIQHSGENNIEINVEKGPNELINENNSDIINLIGIRNKLRVMLISGEPNMGLRSWRNLLNSDPAVELIHFTILRPPEKRDLTSVRELSLIPFPSKELFATNLDKFDLIIFDQYSLTGILPPKYLVNITNYVEKGGALLVASGPSYASNYSLFRSPLKSILPTIPTGKVINKSFTPQLTNLGKRHPVTNTIMDKYTKNNLGKWYRYIETKKVEGQTLLETDDNKSLLILNKVKKGRVAQLLSDHSWVWSRSYLNQGPQVELLRKTIHWLLKEPELQEENLFINVHDSRIKITKNSLEKGDIQAKIITPINKREVIKLVDNDRGNKVGYINSPSPGKYLITVENIKKRIFFGALNKIEFSDVRSTSNILKPIVDKSGGGVYWIEDGLPKIIEIKKEQRKEGKRWLGVISNDSKIENYMSKKAIFPWYLNVFIFLFLFFLAWFRESK